MKGIFRERLEETIARDFVGVEMMTLPSPGSRDLSDLVTAVFRQWRANGIEFVVLRNYEGLPKDTTNDIDVLVLPSELPRAERVLVDTARQAGYRLHNRAEFAPVSLFFYQPESLQQIQFDLFPGLQWRGFSLFSPRAVLERRVERDLFAIPHPAHEAVNNLLTRQIYSGRVKDRYKPIIVAGFQQDTAEARAQLAQMFGARLAEKLTAGILAGRWADVEACTRAMRRELILRRLRRQPLATFRSLLQDAKRLLRRMCRPPGITVVLLSGKEGAKSAVAEPLREALRGSFQPDKSVHIHWKTPLFWCSQGARPSPTQAHAQPSPQRTPSKVAWVYHGLKFLLVARTRFWFVRFRNGLVLIEGSPCDSVAHPQGAGSRMLQVVMRGLSKWIPSPDLVFWLDAPHNHQTSPTGTVSEVASHGQHKAFESPIPKLPNVRVLDATLPAQEVVRSATCEILRYLEARQTKWMQTSP
jgi:hypothetical protein